MTHRMMGFRELCLLLVPALGLAQSPSHVPARISDAASRDLFVMTLGDVRTRLADGIFNLTEDRFDLNGGAVIKNYYRDSLKIAFYRPIDKSVFPLPPSGWCSWYFYYQEIDEHEVEANARWLAANLKDYGAQVVQLDDGWQGTGHGLGENRDWSTIDKRFPSGMDHLASTIRSFGFKAGLWLAPHGQSNERVVRQHPGAFLVNNKDSSASSTWEGTFLVDPSAREGHTYLKGLFTTLSEWGYEYFKIDGQPIVVNEYRSKNSFMKKPSPNADSLYRSTLMTIRSAIGEKTYLLGCWGIPLEGAGIMNGSRTGGDVVLGWSGFKVALSATMKYYYLHNIVWYADPDVMLLRAPLTLPQAQAWATLQGLTGQALMASDRMMDLSAERVNILRRVYPAVDIRPLDLFPSANEKHVWDLKIKHLGTQYDVVGVFNYNEAKSEARFVDWRSLGIETSGPVHVFDFWNQEYLGAWEGGIALRLEPTSCRVLSLVPMEDRPQLVSTNRHITQGWVDVLSASYDDQMNTFGGTSRVVGNDPYELRFAFPRGTGMAVADAAADGLPMTIENHQGWAAVRFTAPGTSEVEWHVAFKDTAYYRYPPRTPSGLRIERVGINGVDVQWNENYYLNAGHAVYLNHQLLGFAPSNSFPLRDLNLDSTYTVSIRAAWQDGSASDQDASITFVPRSLLPNELWLGDVEPVKAIAGYGNVETDRAVSGKPLMLGGKTFQRGIGTHANSEILYSLGKHYTTFSALVGVDGNAGRPLGSVEFSVTGDGKVLWRSGVLRQTDKPKSCRVSINGVESLVLKVSDAGDGINYDHADWVEARVERAVVSH